MFSVRVFAFDFVFVVNHSCINYKKRIQLVVQMIELPCMREKGTAES